MIAHVAEAGEHRGRVVLELTSGDLNPFAIEAALRIAAAFKSEIEGLFIEDQRLFDIASYPSSTEIALSGRRREALTTDRISRQLQHLSASLNRRIAALAAAADVPFKATTVRNDPLAALMCACEDVGPWNVIALAEPVSSAHPGKIKNLFECVSGATGVVIVGRNARRTEGPIVVAIDDIDHLEAQLRAAERLNPSAQNGTIQLVLIAADEVETADMEDQARLLLAGALDLSIQRVSPKFGTAVEMARMLQRIKPGLVIARFGGYLFPRDDATSAISADFECPVFLMR